MKKADAVIIAVLVVISVTAYGVSQALSGHKFAVKYVNIYVKTKLYKKVLVRDNKFEEKINIKTDLGENIVEIENGGARMIDADCPDKICLKEGFKDKAGQTIVCLPHKVEVEIIGEDKPETDEVSY